MAKKVKIPSLKEMQKKFPGFSIASENDDTNLPWLPSRFHAFNYVLGGGIPFGKILELFGTESSGKSCLAYDFAYCCQYLGGVVLWADAEQSFTNAWADTNGLDLSKVIVYRETSIEKISDWVASMALYWRSQLTHNEPILLVLDSVSALDTEANINSEMSDAKADMGNRAKAIYKYFRIRNEMLYSLGVTQIYINQLRTNLKAGMFENPDCLHYNTIIPFVDGTSMKIGDIVRNHISKPVWSYNEDEDKWEPKPIVGWVEKDPTTNWLTIKSQGVCTKNGVISITCTPRHKVLTDKGWKFAKHLKVGDNLITRYTSSYNGTLGKFMEALAIGDAGISVRNSNTANIHLADSCNKEYLSWKVSLLSKYLEFKQCTDTRGNIVYKSNYSVSNAQLKYSIQRDPVKVFENGIDPLTLAVWYMDDGSLYRGKQLIICIPSKRTNIDRLKDIFKKDGFECTYSVKNLKFSISSSEKIFGIICKYIHPSMYYKLPHSYQGKFIPFELYGVSESKTTISTITSIEKAGSRRNKKPYKYDLTIDGNHNFLAGNVDNGILVHNTTPGGAALKFYASQRIGLYGGKTITKKVKGKERKIGKVTSIRTMKNKVAPPRFTIKAAPLYNNPKYHEVGFDKLHFLDEVLLEDEIIEKSSGGVYRFGDKVIARGEEKFKATLAEDDELRRKLLRKAGINTLGATKKKLEKLTENLFPVSEAAGSEEFEEEEDDE